MKIGKILSLLTIMLLIVSCNKNGVAQKASLETQIDTISYAIGMDVAKNVSSMFEEFDDELFYQGYKSVIDSSSLLIEKEKVQQIIQAFMKQNQEKIRKKKQEEAAKEAEKKFGANKKAGEVFLAENISKEGVQTTESGLQYIVLKEGTGEKPTAASKVKVHYHGTLIDGTVFDSSVDKGTPAEFGVGQVIKGWTEGLQLMSVGAKYKFFIAQELAYGAQQRSAQIKPFTALVFEVELLEIVK